mgnify:CR=1 FL=1
MSDKIFSKEACRRITQAIVEAESHTSGEVHVHVAHHCKPQVMDSAIEAFNTLGMQRTKLRNGVLFFFATKDRRFAVIGDKGINDIVGQGFWDDVVATISAAFAKGDPIDGICQSIILCGQKLKEFFPHEKDDANELPDEVSFSK